MKRFNPDSHPLKQIRLCTIAMVMLSKVESRSMSGHVKRKKYSNLSATMSANKVFELFLLASSN
jgi:hypothetical protein